MKKFLIWAASFVVIAILLYLRTFHFNLEWLAITMSSTSVFLWAVGIMEVIWVIVYLANFGWFWKRPWMLLSLVFVPIIAYAIIGMVVGCAWFAFFFMVYVSPALVLLYVSAIVCVICLRIYNRTSKQAQNIELPSTTYSQNIADD